MGSTIEPLINFAAKALNRVGENFHDFISLPLNPDGLFFWGYFLAAAVLAILAYAIHYAGEYGTLRPSRVLHLMFRKSVYLHRSAQVDYAVFVLNQLLTPSILFTRLLSTAWVATLVSQALIGVFPKPQGIVIDGYLGIALFTLFVAMFYDFNIWFVHMLTHRVPLLWEFHKVHHSAEVLTPITVARVHPIEQMFSAFVTTLFSGTFAGSAGFLLLQRPQPLTFFGISAVNAIFYIAGAHLRHSDIWLQWPRVLSHVFISPAQHQIHHSAALQHRDRNYGFIFALWDWMFGSLYVPHAKESLVFGLGDGRPAPHPTVLAAYLAPFKGAWSVLLGKV